MYDKLTNETVAGRKYYAKLELDDGTVLTNYGDDAVGITSISISSTLCGSESVSIGCVNAACATIVLESGTALENRRFTLYLGQEFDGAVEWAPMGIFTGTKAEISEDKLTVEAWDDLYFAGGSYTPDSSVTGTCTFYDALADVCDKLEWGFHGNAAAQTVNGIDVSGLTIAGMPTGLTYSTAIGYLAALLGANACIDRDGCLAFRQFEESGQVLGTDDCYSGGMVFKTSDFTVASLTNTLETETTGDDGETTTETTEVERTTGASGGSIALTNPLMTEDNIDTAWDVVKGFTYRPATLTAVGQLAVDVGDVLRVPTLTGGRNYLADTRTMDGWGKAINVTLEEDDEGYTVATWAATSTLGWNAINTTNAPIQFSLVRGQSVVLSFDVRSDDYEALNALTNRGLAVTVNLCGPDNATRTLYRFCSLYTTVLTDDWQRITVTGTLSDDYFSSGSGDIDDDTRLYIGIFDYSLYSMQVRKVKLELGSTATDWTPAPEDDDESIYLVPVMTHTLEYDGGLKSTITAAGESESQQSAAVSGPVAQQIKELTTKVADTKVLALGKNAVYYAAAAPSADDYTLSVNDLWFDTSGGDYAMYYWDGDKWVAAPFGTSALGDGIITAAKLVAGAVTAEKLNVSELSAITANLGTVTAGDITGTTFTTTGALGYTKLSGGIVTSLGNTAVMAEIPDFEGDGSSLEVTGQPYFDMDGGNIDLYAYETALRASQLGGLHLTATGIYGYPGTLDASDGPWFRLYNPSKAVTINGTLDVTGETTVNNFRVPEVQHGYVDVTPSAAGERTSAEVTFDTVFSGTPTVTATVQTSVPDNRAVGVLSISTTGFTVYVYSSGSGTVRVHWIAVY
ncbi:MAG: H-type lectin domain-containing protein [Clostridiales bacterium]|nr:H-type lectin domain-containing protein [Clostridiales bacterium]